MGPIRLKVNGTFFWEQKRIKNCLFSEYETEFKR
jgi:hypothetical protein